MKFSPPKISTLKIPKLKQSSILSIHQSLALLVGIAVVFLIPALFLVYTNWSTQSRFLGNALPPGDSHILNSTVAQNTDNSDNSAEFYQNLDLPHEYAQSRLNSAGEVTSGTGTASGYPTTILPCTRSGDDLLVLVNKQYKLPSSYAPGDLVPVSNSGIRTTKSGMQVRSIIISDLANMKNDMAAAGIDIAILSAYRSYSTQQSTYNYWVSVLGQAQADRVSARPGHSQHQLGTTVDFTSSEIGDQLGQQFANTQAGQWLAAHAWEYGFAIGYPSGHESVTGYSYEPWHFRYIGVENAASWHASGQILELWLRRYIYNP